MTSGPAPKVNNHQKQSERMAEDESEFVSFPSPIRLLTQMLLFNRTWRVVDNLIGSLCKPEPPRAYQRVSELARPIQANHEEMASVIVGS